MGVRPLEEYSQGVCLGKGALELNSSEFQVTAVPIAGIIPVGGRQAEIGGFWRGIVGIPI